MLARRANNITNKLPLLNDVKIIDPKDGEIIKYTGGIWENSVEASSITTIDPQLSMGFQSTADMQNVSVTYTPGTRTFTATPIAPYQFWIKGKLFTVDQVFTAVISFNEGIHFLHFRDTAPSNPVADQSQLELYVFYSPFGFSNIFDEVLLCDIYFSTGLNNVVVLLDDRMRNNITTGAKNSLIYALGTRAEPCTVSNVTTGGTGGVNSDCEFSVDAGRLTRQERGRSWSAFAFPQAIPVYYKLGPGAWFVDSSVTAALIIDPVTGRPMYNSLSGGNWGLTAVTSGNFINMHIFGRFSENRGEEIVAILAEQQHTTLTLARAAVVDEIISIEDGFISIRLTHAPMFSFVVETKDLYTNAYKARIVDTGVGPYIDHTDHAFIPQLFAQGTGTGTTDHSTLANLLVDSHTQYVLNGGSAARNNLITSMQGIISNTDLTVQNRLLSASTYAPIVNPGYGLIIGKDSVSSDVRFENVSSGTYNSFSFHGSNQSTFEQYLKFDKDTLQFSDFVGIGQPLIKFGNAVEDTDLIFHLQSKKFINLYLEADTDNDVGEESPYIVFSQDGAYTATRHGIDINNDTVLETGFRTGISAPGGNIRFFTKRTFTKAAVGDLPTAWAGGVEQMTIGYTGTTPQITISSQLILSTGTSISEFSTDGTMAGNSDDAVPTEKAIVTYVGSMIPSFAYSTLTAYWGSAITLTQADIRYRKLGSIVELEFPLISGPIVPAYDGPIRMRNSGDTADAVLPVDLRPAAALGEVRHPCSIQNNGILGHAGFKTVIGLANTYEVISCGMIRILTTGIIYIYAGQQLDGFYDIPLQNGNHAVWRVTVSYTV